MPPDGLPARAPPADAGPKTRQRSATSAPPRPRQPAPAKHLARMEGDTFLPAARNPATAAEAARTLGPAVKPGQVSRPGPRGRKRWPGLAWFDPRLRQPPEPCPAAPFPGGAPNPPRGAAAPSPLQPSPVGMASAARTVGKGKSDVFLSTSPHNCAPPQLSAPAGPSHIPKDCRSLYSGHIPPSISASVKPISPSVLLFLTTLSHSPVTYTSSHSAHLVIKYVSLMPRTLSVITHTYLMTQSDLLAPCLQGRLPEAC